MYKIDRLKRSHLDNCFAANKRNASERAYFKIPARSSMHFRDHSKYSAILKRMTLPEMYRVFRKKCVFFTIHCNPSLAYISLQEIFKALNSMRLYSHCYWLANFCTTKIMKILGKHTTFSDHPVH